MRSDIRQFEDEVGRCWAVTKISFGSFVVEPEPAEKLCDIARSCARRLKFSQTANGTPIEYVNEHSRLWNLIWKHGWVEATVRQTNPS